VLVASTMLLLVVGAIALDSSIEAWGIETASDTSSFLEPPPEDSEDLEDSVDALESFSCAEDDK
jgi:hypothetical protein